MRIVDISLLGWAHTAACIIALFAGFAVLAMTKATARHRRVGLWYFYAMVVANLSAFGLFAPIQGIEPGFNRFHWIAIATLVALALGFYAAARQRYAVWAYLHPTGMILSYFSLVGGAINEFVVRIDALRPLVGQPLGIIHALNTLIFVIFLSFFLGKVNGQRGRLPATA